MERPLDPSTMGWRRVLLLSGPIGWLTAALAFLVGLWLSDGAAFNRLAPLTIYFLLPYGLLVGSEELLRQRKLMYAAGRLWQGLLFISLLSTAALLFTGPVAARWWFLVLVLISISKRYLCRWPGIDLMVGGFLSAAIFCYALLLAGASQWPWAAIVTLVLLGMARQLYGSIQYLPDSAATAGVLGLPRATRLALGLFIIVAALPALAYGKLGLTAGGLLALLALNAASFLKYRHIDDAGQFIRGWRVHLWLELLIGFWLLILFLIASNPFSLSQSEGLAVGAYMFCLASGVSLAVTVSNLRALQPVLARPSKTPRVSILIPARNEADIVATTVDAALSQDYPNMEVIVLNDRSIDKTVEAVRPLLAAGATLLQGQIPPPGWTGKNYACYQLASVAQGDYLLFLDADCVLHPEAISRLMGQVLQQKLELISLIPGDYHQSRLETMIMPMAHVISLAFQPLGWLMQKQSSFRPDPGIVQMFHRPAYDMIGGHAKARQSITGADMAASIPLDRYRLILEPALASCRHYRSADELLGGQIRRLYPMLGYNLALLAALFTGGLAYTIGPWVILFKSIPSGPITLSLLAIVLPLASRFSIIRRMGEPWAQLLLYPMGMMTQLLFLPLSFWRYEFGRVNWKGSRLLMRR